MPRSRRRQLLTALAEAGRTLSDATIMFHTALADRLSLNASEWKTLGLLDRHGPLTAGELADRTGLAPPSVTGILDRLERAGWIVRERDPSDRRRVVVRLDASATAERFAASFEGLQRRLDDLYRRFDDDQLALIVEVVQEIADRQRAATMDLVDFDTGG
jgi:DNA-binding MarR family transcriptional regulator